MTFATSQRGAKVARQKLAEWKVHPLLGWLIGILVGVLLFITAGVAILFPIFYSAVHGGFSDDVLALVLLASFVTVAGACFWIAYRVKRAVTRDRPGESLAHRAAGLIAAGAAFGLVLALILSANPEPHSVLDVLPASD